MKKTLPPPQDINAAEREILEIFEMLWFCSAGFNRKPYGIELLLVLWLNDHRDLSIEDCYTSLRHFSVKREAFGQFLTKIHDENLIEIRTNQSDKRRKIVLLNDSVRLKFSEFTIKYLQR